MVSFLFKPVQRYLKLNFQIIMKKNILKKLSEGLKSSMILAVSGSLILISCGVQVGGYTETDGVYYDPEKDTLPEGVITNNTGNTVGEYYDYDNTAYIENVRSRDWIDNSKYWDEGSSTDWGSYAGSETNYYSDSWNYGWSPWGYYSPWGYNPYWGSGWHFGFSWGWGSSWYNPYWGYPYYGFGYSPYYWGGFNPYWGWNSPYYYGYGPSYPYMRSGANGRLYNSYQHPQGNSLRTNSYNGFRNDRIRSMQNQSIRNTNARQPSATGIRNPNIRTQPNSSVTPRQQTTPRYNTPTSPRQPTYQQPQRSQPNIRSNDSGGFRSGSSSGGVRSSGSSTRSGGFRR